MARETRVAIVGAGPYGLACAAFLRNAGIPTNVFGGSMAYWERHMPSGMMLRSRRRASHIADPSQSLTIDDYEGASGARLSEPITVEDYSQYGRWFQQERVPDLDPRLVDRIEGADRGFEITLEDGDTVHAERAVVAAGLEPFAWKPPALRDLPPDLVSHSSEHTDFATLSGKQVVVIGAGQSALESAALLQESGAEVEVVARAAEVVWLPGDRSSAIPARLRRSIVPPTDVGGRVTGWLAAAPDLFRRLPAAPRSEVARRCTIPAGAHWLPSRLAEVPITLGRAAVEVGAANGGARVALDDGTVREADHVLLGTGFRVDISRYGFLSPELLQGLDLVDGYPRLKPGMESSVAGLHFVGAPAAMSFGPLMRFVVGTWHAGPALARAVLGRRQRVIRLSYKPRVALLPRPDLT